MRRNLNTAFILSVVIGLLSFPGGALAASPQSARCAGLNNELGGVEIGLSKLRARLQRAEERLPDLERQSSHATKAFNDMCPDYSTNPKYQEAPAPGRIHVCKRLFRQFWDKRDDYLDAKSNRKFIRHSITTQENRQQKLQGLVKDCAPEVKPTDVEPTWTALDPETEELPPEPTDTGPGCQDYKREEVWKGGHYECGGCRDGFIETSRGCLTGGEIAQSANCPDPRMEKEYRADTGQVVCHCPGNMRWSGSACVAKVAEKTPTMDPRVTGAILGIIGGAISRGGRDRHEGGHEPKTSHKKHKPKKKKKAKG